VIQFQKEKHPIVFKTFKNREKIEIDNAVLEDRKMPTFLCVQM